MTKNKYASIIKKEIAEDLKHTDIQVYVPKSFPFWDVKGIAELQILTGP